MENTNEFNDLNKLRYYMSIKDRGIVMKPVGAYLRMDSDQLPLSDIPKDNCKKCFGRLIIGMNTMTNQPVFCPSCFRKYVDQKAISEKFRQVMEQQEAKKV